MLKTKMPRSYISVTPPKSALCLVKVFFYIITFFPFEEFLVSTRKWKIFTKIQFEKILFIHRLFRGRPDNPI